jgi:hypothetical protein
MITALSIVRRLAGSASPRVDWAEASDAALALAARSRDRTGKEAFVEIVRRHQTAVCAVACSVTGRIGLADDIAQDVFLKAWQRIGTLREPAKLKPWLMRIAHGCAFAFAIYAGKDPSAARSAAEAMTGPSRVQALAGAAAGWAGKDGAAALAWSRRLTEGQEREAASRATLIGWAKSEPRSALEHIAAAPPAQVQGQFASDTAAQVLAGASAKDFEGTMRWLERNGEKIGPESWRGMSFEIQKRLAADPAGTLRSLASQPPLVQEGLWGALHSGMSNELYANKEAVWAWLKTQPADENMVAAGGSRLVGRAAERLRRSQGVVQKRIQNYCQTFGGFLVFGLLASIRPAFSREWMRPSELRLHRPPPSIMRILFSALLPAVFGALLINPAGAAVIAHWTFDTGAITLDGNNNVATAADTTGAHNATATVLGTSTGLSVAGRFGAGLQLNNATGTQAANQYYLTFPNLTELMGPAGGSYSVAAWVNIAAGNAANNAIVADWGNVPAGNRFDYWFTVNAGGVRAQSRASNTPNDDIFARQPAAPLVNNGQWRHIAWTWDKAAATLTSYVDGVQIDQLTAVPPPLDLMVSDSAVGAIGRKADNNQHFAGSMDEIWVATGVFSPATVLLLFNANQIPEPGSIALLGGGVLLLGAWRRRRSE